MALNLEIKVRSSVDAPQAMGLREKVFEICKLLLAQQKATIVTLQAIEERVKLLREDFATVIERKRPWVTPGQIEQLFNENKTLDVANVLKKLEEKNLNNQLSKELETKLTLGDEKMSEDKPFLLTEKRHRGMQPRRIQQEPVSFLKRTQPPS